jgi:hypothetical protein
MSLAEGPSARESASNRCVFVVSSLAGIVLKLPRVSSPANASRQPETPNVWVRGANGEVMKKGQLAIEENLQCANHESVLQLIAIFLTAISIALIMSPAAYHRIVEPEIGSEFFVRFTSALIACAMVPLMISLTLDAYIVAILVVRSVVISAAIAICVFAPPRSM